MKFFRYLLDFIMDGATCVMAIMIICLLFFIVNHLLEKYDFVRKKDDDISISQSLTKFINV